MTPGEPWRRLRDIEQTRVDDRRGHQRRLRGPDRGRRHAEVRPRRRIGAVDPVAPLDHVEVDLEDPRLLELGLEAARDDQLAELPDGIPRRREVEVLGELLRDGARAAHEAQLHGLLQLVVIHALVLPEGRVFGDQYRALQVRRDPAVRDPALHAARRLPLRTRFMRAQLDEGGRGRILVGKCAHVRKRQVRERDPAEGRGGGPPDPAHDAALLHPATTTIYRLEAGPTHPA